jgi:hypothetical protein
VQELSLCYSLIQPDDNGKKVFKSFMAPKLLAFMQHLDKRGGQQMDNFALGVPCPTSLNGITHAQRQTMSIFGEMNQLCLTEIGMELLTLEDESDLTKKGEIGQRAVDSPAGVAVLARCKQLAYITGLSTMLHVTDVADGCILHSTGQLRPLLIGDADKQAKFLNLQSLFKLYRYCTHCCCAGPILTLHVDLPTGQPHSPGLPPKLVSILSFLADIAISKQPILMVGFSAMTNLHVLTCLI